MNAEIFETLQTDARCRVIGSDDLCPLARINLGREWDFSLPTLHTERRPTIVHTKESFTNKFYELYPYFRGVDLSNVLVAGGCVSGILTKTSYDDIDLFFYGITAEEATERLRALIEDIILAIQRIELEAKAEAELAKRYYSAKYSPKDFIAIRNNNCVTLKIGRNTLQFILRVYPNKADILHSFDLGSSAVGFCPVDEEVYFTSLSKLSYELGINVVDTTRRSTTYESRLSKYFERGFEIVLPHLDITKMRREYLKYGLKEMMILPHCRISYREINGNVIEGTQFYLSAGQRSDYQEDIDNKYQVFSHNLAKFLAGSSDFYYIAFGNQILDVLSTSCALSANQIILFYNRLVKKIFDGDRLSFSNVKKYLGMTAAEVAEKISANRKNLDVLVAEKREVALQKFKELAPIPLTFQSGGGPDSQVVGSFNPIIAAPEDWYGEYYLPPTGDDQV